MGEGANLVVTVIDNLFRRYRATNVKMRSILNGLADKHVLQQHLVQFFQLSGESNHTFFQRMLWIPVAFLVGAAVYFSIRHEPTILEWGIVVFMSLVCGSLVRLFPQAFRALPDFLVLLLIFAVLGGCYSAFRAHTMPSKPISASMDRVMVEGWIASVTGADDRDRYLIEVQAISGVSSEQLPRYVRLSVRQKEALNPGRFVRCFAGLRTPPSAGLPGDYNFSQQAYFSGLGAVGFVYGQCEPGRIGQISTLSERWSYKINAQRRDLAKRIANEGSQNGGQGLAAAVLTGDRSFLSEADQETLQATGLAHLLAISGLHMGLAAGIFYFILFRLLVLIEPLAIRFPVQKLAQVGALIAITFYLVFSGASISTQRAYIMLSVALVFGLLDRPVVSFQALTLSMFIVILITPSAVMTPGFQMSFAATAALIAAYRMQVQKSSTRIKSVWFGKLQTFLFGVFLTSWVAGISTMPFAIYHFDRAAPLGFFANLIVMPIITIVSVPLGAATAISLPFGIEAIPLELFGQSLGLVIRIARLFEVKDGLGQVLNVGRLPILSAVLFSAALLVWIIRQRRGRVLTALCLVSGFAIWMSQPKPFFYSDGTGHMFLRADKTWQEIDVGASGLRPLRFADVEEVECRSGCTIKLDENRSVQLRRDLQTVYLTDSDREQGIEINQFPNGFQLISSRKTIKATPLPEPPCRPWSPHWKECSARR